MLQSLVKLTHNNRVHLLWLMNLIYRLFAGFGGTLHAWILATYFIAMMEITSISFSKAAWTLGQLLASLLIRLYLNQHWVPHGVHNYRWCLYYACNIINVSRMMFLSQVWESPVHRMTDVRVSNGGERKSLRLESSLYHIHHLRLIPRNLRVLKHVQQLPFCLICILRYLSIWGSKFRCG